MKTSILNRAQSTASKSPPWDRRHLCRRVSPTTDAGRDASAPRPGNHPAAAFAFGPAPRPTPQSSHAFTMIEIALSLAVIGFALVAIIGILPAAMEVQRENREETMINQDAGVFLDAIRSGSQGMDDLTNYVIAVTNYVTTYVNGSPIASGADGYGPTFSPNRNGVTFWLTNGYRIVGLLSTPKYQLVTNGNTVGYSSNYVVAFMRALSGPASDKPPQKNASMQDLAFSYRMIADIVPFASYDFNWTNYTALATNTPDYAVRQSYYNLAKNVQNNLFDVRLAFRFPLLNGGSSGNGRMDSRSLVSGTMTNDLTVPEFPIFFFQPRTYVKAP